MNQRYLSFPESKLRMLYENHGLSLRSIAKMHRCDPGVIARALRQHKIAIRPPNVPIPLDGHDLRALYQGKKLSTYQIASQYDCDPKTVYRYLKLNNIPTRCRKRITLTKETLYRQYVLERKSLSDIARVEGYSAAGILKKLKLYNIARRPLSETSTKHLKHDFNGDRKEMAYLIGFRIGDLGVRQRANLIYISSGTTKEVQSELIKSLFCKYGPIWLSKINGGNAVNITCALNNSFSFLLPKYRNIPKWVLSSSRAFLAFLAGYTDAEGNIQISNGMAKFRIRSCDVGILRDIHFSLKNKGVDNIFALERKAGVDKRHIRLNKDCWMITVNEKHMLSKLLIALVPLLRHAKRREDAERALENVSRRISLLSSNHKLLHS